MHAWCPAVDWYPIVVEFPCLAPSAKGIDSSSNMTLTMIKQLLKMNVNLFWTVLQVDFTIVKQFSSHKKPIKKFLLPFTHWNQWLIFCSLPGGTSQDLYRRIANMRSTTTTTCFSFGHIFCRCLFRLNEMAWFNQPLFPLWLLDLMSLLTA